MRAATARHIGERTNACVSSSLAPQASSALRSFRSSSRRDIRCSASLFRVALEKATAGARFHGVAEEAIAFRDIAAVIGTRLNVPVVAKSSAEAANHFTWFAAFAGLDCPACRGEAGSQRDARASVRGRFPQASPRRAPDAGGSTCSGRSPARSSPSDLNSLGPGRRARAEKETEAVTLSLRATAPRNSHCTPTPIIVA